MTDELPKLVDGGGAAGRVERPGRRCTIPFRTRISRLRRARQTWYRASRDNWGFGGYVVSDCGAVGDIATGHRAAPDTMHTPVAAVRAGTDLSCGSEYARLADAVTGGLVAESVLDRSLIRVFTARFRLGMFDPPERVPYAGIPHTENDSAAHRALALEAAERSTVLLKNARGRLAGHATGELRGHGVAYRDAARGHPAALQRGAREFRARAARPRTFRRR